MANSPVLPIAFTGAPGAYSQEAARRFFGASYPTLTCGNSEDAIEALTTERASHAVLPVENTITGPYPGVPESLRSADVHVIGEVDLPIRHCLLGVPGARMEDVAVVRSHPTALAQCRDRLAAWGVATRVSGDTAQAARELSRSGDGALGVLGSEALASMYGLEVLAEDVSDRMNNRTRFFVFGAGGASEEQTSASRSAFLLGQIHAPRVLKTLRIQLESRGAIRTRAPFLGSEDGSQALVEFDHPPGIGYPVVAGACSTLDFTWLGSWTPASRPAGMARGA